MPKYVDPNKGILTKVPEKPLRYTKDSFTQELIGKKIKLTLTTNKELVGKLIELGMYDILMETTETKEVAKGMFKDVSNKIIVLKGVIAMAEVL